MHKSNTKIVCTIGPASSNKTTLVKMIRAGMNVARINFSHGTYESLEKLIQTIRIAEKETGSTIAIMQDLQGPKIRIGNLPPNGVSIKAKESFILDCANKPFNEKSSPKTIPIQYKELYKDVKKGDIILIEDGMIQTTVESVKDKNIKVKMMRE